MSSVEMSIEAKSAAAPGRSVVTRSANAVARLERLLLSLALPVGLAVAWELAVRAGLSDGRLVPPPSRIFEEFAELWRAGELSRHVVATLLRVAVGFGLGTVAGTLLGALAGYSSLTRRTVYPLYRCGTSLNQPGQDKCRRSTTVLFLAGGRIGRLPNLHCQPPRYQLPRTNDPRHHHCRRQCAFFPPSRKRVGNPGTAVVEN